MSTADSHWKGRQLPDGTRIRDGRHIEDLISKVRTKQGLKYNPMDPAGPVLRDIALHQDEQSGIPLLSRINAIPDDTSQRTPLRYAPVPKMEEIESLSTQDTVERERTVHIDESLNETFSPTQDRLIDPQRDMTGLTESPVENLSPDESPPTDPG